MLRIMDTGGTLRTIKRLSIKDASGVLRLLQTLKIKDAGGVLRTVYTYFYVDFTIGPTVHNSLGSTGSYINTVLLTSAITGGTGPFTYACATDDTTGTVTVLAPSTSTPQLRTTTYAGDPGSGAAFVNATITVTDTSDGTTRTVTHPVTITAAF